MTGKTVTINGFRLDFGLDSPPPIYVGAQGRLMLRTAGELGDGVITNFVTPEALPTMLEEVTRARFPRARTPPSSTWSAGSSP